MFLLTDEDCVGAIVACLSGLYVGFQYVFGFLELIFVLGKAILGTQRRAAPQYKYSNL